jgi:hypothetical protein
MGDGNYNFSSSSRIFANDGRWSGFIFQQLCISVASAGGHEAGTLGVLPSSRIDLPTVIGSSFKCGSCCAITSNMRIPNDQASERIKYVVSTAQVDENKIKCQDVKVS